MPSIFCRDCQGAGYVVKCEFTVPCQLCQINDVVNQYYEINWKNLSGSLTQYFEALLLVEKSPFYWEILDREIASGNIKLEDQISNVERLFKRNETLLTKESEINRKRRKNR